MEYSAFLHELSAYLADFTKSARIQRLLSQGRLSPAWMSGLGVTGEARTMRGTAAGAMSELPAVEESQAEKRREAEETERPEVKLPALDVPMGAEAVRWQSHVAQLRRSASSLHFPPLQSTRQESAKGQPGQKEAISWGKGDGEEMSRRRSRAEKGKTPSPWLETPQLDIRPPRGRQVLTNLELYRSRQEQWRRNAELNRLRAMAPKQFLCVAKKMEVHDPRKKPEAGAAGRGMSAHSGQVAPRRPTPRH